MTDRNNEQPPSNPAGPAASQQPAEECRHRYTTFTGRCDLCGLTPGDQFDKSHRKQPAEAVSEAAREAASELQRRARYEEDLLTDSEVKQIIQRAVTAASAAQQAEIAALREELVKSVASNANEIDTLRSQLQEAKRLNGALKEERDKYQGAATLAVCGAHIGVPLPGGVTCLYCEVNTLRSKVYMSGTWKCDTCGFEWNRRILNLSTGECGAPIIEEVPICPNNDRQPMRRVTWEECAASNYEACQRFLDERDTAIKERDEARYIANQTARDLDVKRQKYGKIDADIRQAVRATGFCEIEGSAVGLVESICDLATQRVKELEELRAARRKEVRITFDKIEGSFNVTFGRTGQTVKFEKPKHVAGNVENWLANLRHAQDE